MITTVTLNAAIDRTLVVPNFVPERRHRASNSVTLAGGKGINVARALKTLGAPVVATGMIGGLPGANIVKRLTEEGILNDFVRIGETSRTSTAVIDPISGGHTEINEYGPRVQASEMELFFDKLRYLTRASRCIVLAGSLPRAVEPDTYQRIIRSLPTHEIISVVTSPDDPNVLRLSLAAEPTIAIIDQREAEHLVGHEFSGTDDFILALGDMARMGGQSLVITRKGGCVCRIKQGRTVTYIEGVHGPVEVESVLGATDTFCAGYIASLLEDRPPLERVSIGVAAAVANMRLLGAGRFERAEFARQQREVSSRELEPAEFGVEA